MDNWCQGRPKTFLCVSLSFDSASAATAYIGIRNWSIRDCVFLTYKEARNVPCLETGTEVLYGNRFTCALVHSWQRFRRRFPCVFTRSSFFLLRTTDSQQCTHYIVPHSIQNMSVWIWKTYLRHVLVPVYHLQGVQQATLNTNFQC